MPTYDFKCTECGTIKECIVPSFSAVPEKFCECEGIVHLERVETFTKNRPVFRGTGFYETDYKRG